ncbi:MAG: caspase family protein [Pseudomonadota bacterium]|nr:caspase family protein [Pseudomonadota bacterium]
MEKLALLFGASEYTNADDLGCCERDVEAVQKLIEHSGEDYSVLKLFNTSSDITKNQIRAFFEENSEVKETFVYFSGHGLATEDDFLFCTSDFQSQRQNSTSVSRTFLLNVLRDAKVPSVALVIDACESGKSLIKSHPRAFDPPHPLEKFWQLSSSHSNQYSYTGDPLSSFTKAFIQACLAKDDGPLYYSDIQDGIKDYFGADGDQTPYFISQGTAREKLCSDVSNFNSVRSELQMLAGLISSDAEFSDKGEPLSSFFDELQKIEPQFATKETLQNQVTALSSALCDFEISDGQISEVYDVQTEQFDSYRQSDLAQVVKVINDRPKLDNFVTAKSTTKFIGDPSKQPGLGLLGIRTFAKLNPDDYVTTNSLTLNCSLDQVEVELRFIPKFQSLTQITSRVLFVPTLTELLVFWKFETQVLSDWGQYNSVKERIDWQYSVSQIGEGSKLFDTIEVHLNAFALRECKGAVERFKANG